MHAATDGMTAISYAMKGQVKQEKRMPDGLTGIGKGKACNESKRIVQREKHGAREGTQLALIFKDFKHIGVIFGEIAISKTAMLTGTY